MNKPKASPRFRLLVIPFISLVLVTAGCKSTRTAYKVPLKEEGPEYLVRQLRTNQLDFSTFSSKYSASFSQGRKSAEFTGQLRIIRDSAIWVSISPAFGIEMIRLLVTQDSVKYINRIDKLYYSGDYSILQKFLDANVDFDILQALIIGNDFRYYEDVGFRASVDDREYKLSTSGRRKTIKQAESDRNPIILVQNIWLDPQTFKITRVDLKEYQKDNKHLGLWYSNFQPVDEQVMPGNVRLKIVSKDVVDVNFDFNRPVINPALTLPFSIPQSYDRLH